jgi:nucleoside-diphosphate-sugar epimerase
MWMSEDCQAKAGSVNLFDLMGEIATVIGGTGVLGGAIAEGLALAGAKVAVLGRNQNRGESRKPDLFRVTVESRNFSLPTLSILNRLSPHRRAWPSGSVFRRSW